MEKAHTATAKGEDFPVSRKVCVEIANFIRGRSLKRVKTDLNGVLSKKVAVPFRRSNKDRGHKTGMSAGRYPHKATQKILELLASAEKNAINQGLNAESLFVSSIMINKGTTQWRHGRQKRIQAKKAHIQVELTENPTPRKEKKQEPKTEKKEDKK